MFCSNCGKEIADGMKFCMNCGTPVADQPQTAQSDIEKHRNYNDDNYSDNDDDDELEEDEDEEDDNDDNYSDNNDNYSNRKLRHGFTSFYLWLCILCFGIAILVLLIDFFMNGELILSFYSNMSNWDIWVMRIGVILSGYGFIKLLKWEKSGFWLIVGVTVAIFILNPTHEAVTIKSVIATVVPVGILFGVLQFKNAYNAKSTWEQLN